MLDKILSREEESEHEFCSKDLRIKDIKEMVEEIRDYWEGREDLDTNEIELTKIENDGTFLVKTDYVWLSVRTLNDIVDLLGIDPIDIALKNDTDFSIRISIGDC